MIINSQDLASHICDYVEGRMSDSERPSFEALLARYPVLRRQVDQAIAGRAWLVRYRNRLVLRQF